MPAVTVAIPTFNGLNYLKELIPVLRNQKQVDLEILICDSSSSDGTWEYLANFKEINAFQIPQADFSHGGTRQILVERACNEIIIFLSQDALPYDENWAYQHWLTHQELPSNIAAILGTQLPQKNAHAAIAQRINRTFRSLGNTYAISIFNQNSVLAQKFGKQPLAFLSDVHVSYKRKILLNDSPFKNVAYAEDQLMARDLIEKNYGIAFAPLLQVFHSNDLSVLEYKNRIFEEISGAYTALEIPIPKLKLKSALKDFAVNVFFDLRYIFSQLNRHSIIFVSKEILLIPLFELQNIRGRITASKLKSSN